MATDNVSINQTLFSLMNSYLPDNPMEPPFEAAWNCMNENYSRFQIACFGSICVHEVFFVLLNLPLFMAQFWPYMRRFKIQEEKPETYTDQWKAIKLVTFSHICIYIPFCCGLYIFTEVFKIPFGWDTMPSWYSMSSRIFVCLVIEDTWQYFLHRIMHHKRLYRHVHKVHHTFQAPFSITAEYAHPLDVILGALGTMWGVLFLANHLIVIWTWIMVRLLETYDVHSGYEFPFNPLHLIPFYAGARFHDFHHTNFNGNYSTTFTWWDRLFGTDRQYKEHLKGLDEKKHSKKDL